MTKGLIVRLRVWLCRKVGHVYRVTHWSVDSMTVTCAICKRQEDI
jgi:hypothetical protein